MWRTPGLVLVACKVPPQMISSDSEERSPLECKAKEVSINEGQSVEVRNSSIPARSTTYSSGSKIGNATTMKAAYVKDEKIIAAGMIVYLL